MKNLFSVLITLLFLTSCHKKITEKVVETPVITPKIETIPPPVVATQKAGSEKLNIPEGISPDLVASIKRSPCFGKCPYYKVEIFSTGKVIYEGIAHVKRLGKFEAKVNEEILNKILEKASAIGYLKLSDKYPTGDLQIADLPSTTTYIRIGNDGKIIYNNHDAPLTLIEYERWLDAEIDKWVFTEMKN